MNNLQVFRDFVYNFCVPPKFSIKIYNKFYDYIEHNKKQLFSIQLEKYYNSILK